MVEGLSVGNCFAVLTTVIFSRAGIEDAEPLVLAAESSILLRHPGDTVGHRQRYTKLKENELLISSFIKFV